MVVLNLILQVITECSWTFDSVHHPIQSAQVPLLSFTERSALTPIGLVWCKWTTVGPEAMWCCACECVWPMASLEACGYLTWTKQRSWHEWVSIWISPVVCFLTFFLSKSHPSRCDLNPPGSQVVTSAYYNQLYLHDSVSISLQKITFFPLKPMLSLIFFTMAGTMRHVITSEQIMFFLGLHLV